MATNKHAIIRYQTLDKCFRNPGRKYYIEDLVNACDKSIHEFTGGDTSIKKRQIFEDIKFMESSQGWSIELERVKDGRKVYYRYADRNFSINNKLLNESEENQLKEVLLTLARFKGMPHFEWIDEMLVRLESSFGLTKQANTLIEFEQNQYLKGLEFFSDIFNAILYKKPLEVSYKGFKQERKVDINFHPYYLKQYNNRWFIFGRTDYRKNITNLAIDRIQNLAESKILYIDNDIIDFNTFFEDAVGVSIPEEATPEKIVINISSDLWPYIESKPLHGSQKLIKKTASHTVIQLELYINYELISLLFSMGEGLTVIKPETLSKAIKTKAKAIIKNYS